MQEITSLQNPIIKETTALHQKKYRAESGMFLAEGFKCVEEALRSGLEIKYVFVNSESNKQDKFFELLETTKTQVYFVDEKIMKKISTTETPPEIVAVAFQKKFSLQDIFKQKNSLIIVLENIKDAGNLGTVIRTAKAADVSGIILTGDCTDIYNPKVIRSSAGNLWKLPVVYFKDTGNLRQEIEKFNSCRFFATKVAENRNSKFYNEVDYKQPAVIFFGSEAEGISDILANQADELIKIPMNKEIESLNLSISAGIIMYEAFRQRKN